MKIGDFVKSEEWNLKCAQIIDSYVSKNDPEHIGWIINPLVGDESTWFKSKAFKKGIYEFRNEILTPTFAPKLDDIFRFIKGKL